MLVETAAILTAIGLACWVLGTVLGQPEIAVLGGTIVLGVGAVISGAGGGLEQKTGETEIQEDNTTTETDFEYEEVETPTQLPLGGVIMILGGTIVLRGFNTFAKQ